MVALPSDVARSGKSAQRLRDRVQSDGEDSGTGLSNIDHSHRAVAQAVAAMCVGGMVIARAIADRALADELRGDCMAVALKLGGWNATMEQSRIDQRISRARWGLIRAGAPSWPPRQMIRTQIAPLIILELVSMGG
jgi:hypothetical protein